MLRKRHWEPLAGSRAQLWRGDLASNSMAPVGGSARSVLAALENHGLLLQQDKVVTSVVGLITGESLRTSWWSHPKSHLIYSVLSELSEHSQVVFTKLLARKDTLVHSGLWPALLAVGSARDEWQLRGLSAAAADLLERVDRSASAVRATGAACKEIQVRLLAPSYEIHTEDGRHAMMLERWSAWSSRMSCMALTSGDEGRRRLEQAATDLGAPLHYLPWRTRD
jgi:hypothetical protein